MTAPPNPTLAQLQAMLPEAAIEISPSGEVVIYTGWALDPLAEDPKSDEDPENAPLIKWEAPF